VTFEESTTFECTKRGISWEAAAETDPVARRADGFFPTDAEAVSVTSDAVFVDEDRGDKASVVRRLDPRTGKTMWARRVGDADRIAAGTERVWVADAARGRVLGLDVRTGTIKSTTDVGPGNFDAIAPGANQPVATTPDGVWVATAQGLLRLDPATGARIEQLPVGAVEGVVAGPSGLITAAPVPGPDGRSRGHRRIRIYRASRARHQGRARREWRDGVGARPRRGRSGPRAGRLRAQPPASCTVRGPGSGPAGERPPSSQTTNTTNTALYATMSRNWGRTDVQSGWSQ
jgi:hypothetical protein